MCININKNKNKNGIQQVGNGNEANQDSKNLLNEVKKIARRKSLLWGFVSGVVTSLDANCVFEWLKSL